VQTRAAPKGSRQAHAHPHARSRPAGGEGGGCGASWGLLARFKRAWVPELVNTALILYSWRVGLSLKTVRCHGLWCGVACRSWG